MSISVNAVLATSPAAGEGWRRAEAAFRSARAAHGRSAERSAAWTGTTFRTVPRAALTGTKRGLPAARTSTAAGEGKGVAERISCHRARFLGVHVTLLGPRPTFVTSRLP